MTVFTRMRSRIIFFLCALPLFKENCLTSSGATRKKEARMTKDNMAKDSNDRATRYGLSWGEAQAAAKDRTLWRNNVVALCPTGDEEDK